MHSVSVAGVVINSNGEVLTIRRSDNDHWEAPGGVLEIAETFEEGVRREVSEETGVVVQVERLTGVYKHMSRGIVALVFRCVPVTETPHATAEAREVRWMTRDEVRTAMDPAFAIRVLDAFESKVCVRVHDGVHVLAAAPGEADHA
jgi:mutator protein MutT